MITPHRTSLNAASHLCSHEGERVHAVSGPQQATDQGQAAAVQEQGDEQAQHPHVAVHGGGGRKRQLRNRNTRLN